MGASYDAKWAVIGGAIILTLQFATIFVIWQLAGKKFLTGPPRQSLFEASIESVDPDYGYHKSNDRVQLSLKLDNKGRDTAAKVTAIYFGKKKAAPYLPEELKRQKTVCAGFCADAKKFSEEVKTCNQQICKKADALKKQKLQCDQCVQKCGGYCKLEQVPTLPEALKGVCMKCPATMIAFRNAKTACDACQSRLRFLQGEQARCKACDATLADLARDAKRCKPSGLGCFSRTYPDRHKELAAKLKAKPKRQKGESAKAYKAELKAWKESVDRVKRDLSKAERRIAFVFAPVVDKPGPVSLRVRFVSGDTATRNPGYYYVESKSSGRPNIKTTKKDDKPTGHVGFWIMLAISLVVYFLGGMFTGRLSPGITMKEPATAGIFAGIIYFVFLFMIGADFSVVIFSSIIGVPAFAGAAFFGGWVGEKWQGTI
ncbi:MAG: hypothetical protein J7M25_08745 [Deltaproteobacteria bacterium]|nr:hypothetical protein [Deltaproteobacteria bacterium]